MIHTLCYTSRLALPDTAANSNAMCGNDTPIMLGTHTILLAIRIRVRVCRAPVIRLSLRIALVVTRLRHGNLFPTLRWAAGDAAGFEGVHLAGKGVCMPWLAEVLDALTYSTHLHQAR